ncbi:hypothetical protein AArcSl_1652 [Halalkaliarchaeum desulfuricum]|uniref:Uncharacterized protein n=1 Tax=Halalkaliarchaeum desulfuricum TaxID=2055893 RepID=A0A343TJK9_9EURY|nr:hypothetical protein [Halalkaliarchaeum desulfuricum]AUX09281.1 hypothetical protein AArcSl_1652 [Halalkaliarchaeum desulfuricum]
MATPVDWLRELLKDGIGQHSPGDQITAGLILGAVIIATSAVGLVGTLLLMPIPILMAGFGILRLSSTVDQLYPL